MRNRIWMAWGLLAVGACVDIPAQAPPSMKQDTPDMAQPFDQGPDAQLPDQERPDAGPKVCQPQCQPPEVCDLLTGLCVGCLTDFECESSPAGALCLEGRCVECKASEDCAVNQVCLPSHICVECETSSDCDPARPQCMSNTCVECLNTGDCPVSRGQCFENRCVECKDEFDCLAKPGQIRCQLELNQCVACTLDEHCDLASTQPHCGSDFTCQACKGDEDCDYPGYSLSCEVATGRCRFRCTNVSMCADGEICTAEGICLPS